MKKIKEKNINLYKIELVSSNFPKKVLVAVLMTAFFIAFIWFGIIDRYIEINTLEGVLTEETSNLEMIKESCNELNFNKDDYIRYSKDYLTTKERSIVSRVTVFNKIDEYLMSSCDVAKIQLDGNELVTTLYNATLGEASIVIDKMLHDSDSAVEYAKTQNAKHDDTSKSTLDMMIVFAGNEEKEVSFEE